MPGSGGIFLTSYINSARINLSEMLTYSEKSGHAHLNKFWKALFIGDDKGEHWIEDDSLAMIQQIVESSSLLNTTPPYYGCFHISDIKLMQTYFKKSLRIVYEESDMSEITLSYIGKFEIDIKNTIIDSNIYVNKLNRTKRFQDSFDPTKHCNANMGDISWKDLLKNDPSILIDKLHSITDIPKENFSIDTLSEWRHKTSVCIENTKELVITKYNIQETTHGLQRTSY